MGTVRNLTDGELYGWLAEIMRKAGTRSLTGMDRKDFRILLREYKRRSPEKADALERVAIKLSAGVGRVSLMRQA